MCAAITSAALGVGMAGYQIYQGSQQKKEGQRELSEYERQELDNAFKEISISTYGSDLLREENARTSAGLIDAARQGGSRSIIGAIPKVVGATNQINQQAAKLIDDQAINREYAIAGDNARIEGITENRDIQNINAIGSKIQAGNQDMWSGMMGVASSLAYANRNINSAKGTPAERMQLEGTATTNPNGVVVVPFDAPLPTASVPFASSTPYSALSSIFDEDTIRNQLRRKDMVTNQINF
jgi:hypothetical protein